MKKNKNRNVPHGTFLFKVLVLIGIMAVSIMPSYNAYTLPILYGESNLLLDADSGVIYLADNIDDQRGIASLTKLMSIYVVYDQLEEQEINLDQKVTISNKVANLHNINPSISGVYYNQGQQETVEDLIDLTLVYSDNGAIIALSEFLSGNEQNHVKRMNEKAEELGMTNTIFYNVTGLTMVDYGEYKLPGTSDKDYNKSSARDMGVLAYNLIKDYPQVLDVTSKPTITYQGYEYYNFNELIEGLTYGTEGVKGLKTGTTKEAGECLMTYYSTEDRNYITVSLDVPLDDYSNRFIETQTMYEWIDEQLLVPLISEKEKFQSVNIKGDKEAKVDLYSKTTVEVLKSDNMYFNLTSSTLNPEYFNEDGLLIKDIPKGTTVKTLYFSVPSITEEEKELGLVPPIQSIYGSENEVYVDLVAQEDIKVAGAIQKVFLSIEYFVQDLFN